MTSDSSVPSSELIEGRILIVDDNPGTAETLGRALARINPKWEVLAANNGNQAIQQLQGRSIDLLITDLIMPGMDGFQLIEQLRQQSPGNRFHSIIITAYDIPGLRESARRMKVSEVLIKPFSPERICQLAQRLLDNVQPTTPLAAPQKSEARFKILVADDNPNNLALLLRYLQQEDYDLLTASDGLETLQKLHTERPDLVLLDVSMPEMDGFQVLERAQADPTLKHIPIIIVTAARLDPVDLQYALNLGAADYLTKPFDRRELVARVRARLRDKINWDVMQRRQKELNLLLDIAQRVNQPRDVPALSEFLLHRTAETLDAWQACLCIQTPKETFVQIWNKDWPQVTDQKAPRPEWLPLLDWQFRHPEGVVIENVRQHSDWPLTPGDLSHSAVLAFLQP
ncbi:MAG: response regulator, partial [Anaerolineales bacterium]|nr:response regulator [Anaerolineales bacterium]